MSNAALSWAWMSDIGQPGAKFVLVALADHAGDHAGEDWTCYPSIQRLVRMTGQGERTVERHLIWLGEQGFISRAKRTGRVRTGSCYVYTLHRHRASPANLAGVQVAGQGVIDGGVRVLAQASTAANLAGDGAGAPPANSDTTARQTGGDHPPKTTPHIDEPSGNPHEPARAREGEREALAKPHFERLQAAWVRVSPGRVQPKASWRAFLQQADEWPPERICDAGLRYLSQDPDVRRLGATRLHVWLLENRFEPWLTAGDKRAPERPGGGWTGPPAIREQVSGAKGEAFAAAYLDPASWDAGAGLVLARTRIAHERLAEVLGAASVRWSPP